MGARAEALAERVEQGTQALLAVAASCTEAEWGTYCPEEQRTVGVLVHHVALAYLAEITLMQTLASGQAITGLTWEMANQMNAQHAAEHANPDKEGTLALLRRNSVWAADAIRRLTDEQLDRAARVSLHWDAPLTTQYFIEQHAISHSYSHLRSIEVALHHRGSDGAR